MSLNKPPLLITASLDPGRTPQVALSDVRERVLRHLEGLLAWLREPWVEKLVFVKNCTLPINAEVLVEAASRYGKELEFVQVSPARRTAIQGKGFGEGDLIRQALEASRILRSSRDFLKITGKLFMPEAFSVFTGEGVGEFFVMPGQQSGGISAMRHLLSPAYRSAEGAGVLGLLRRCRVPWGWIAAVPSGWVDTRCYRVERACYRTFLELSHQRVWDGLGYTLENAFHDDVEAITPIRTILTPPVIIGASGTLGTMAGSCDAKLAEEAEELSLRLLHVTKRA